MRGNNIMGIIFANLHEDLISELTDVRITGAVPFGGKYRMIDFPLSNMVNSGINKVGVLTKSNYQSIMDHVGTGKAWDLSRKQGGLFILPPFTNTNEYSNRLTTLNSIMPFLKHSTEEYVVITDCDTVCNIDFQDVCSKHLENNADITVVYKRDQIPEKLHDPTVFSFDAKGQVIDVAINSDITGSCSFYMNIMFIKRELLIELVNKCISKNTLNFKRDIIQGEYKNLSIYGYEFNGFSPILTSMSDYFQANMALMKADVRADLFKSARPIYTKVRDDMPTKYGLGSKVTNSLIANGCTIEGEVENCVLFKGVHIGKNTKVSNCVIMQDTVIGADSSLSYVIVDKDVKVKDERTLMGFSSYPVYISKGSVV
ncbi:MAG: glucose-1-phosphate adenylyltransferase subunit GlgD [Clostridia bacterium]|nr:glucose-1-phosphate adenylyltransferase subunit GlgD [Clostridia bacterium]